MSGQLASLRAMFARDLAALRREVEAYPDDESPWRDIPGLTNAGGTLVLHLAGNLQHFIGAVLGSTGYQRDRATEFSKRGVPRAALVAEVERAREAVLATLDRLPEAALDLPYPEAAGNYRFITGDLLTHILVHLSYHLGQLDYHRRAATGKPDTIGASALSELATARPA